MTRFVDLSHTVEDGMVTYPGLPGPRISAYLTREASRERYQSQAEFEIGQIEMVANTGTYLDMPYHRYAGGRDLADLSLAEVADLPGLCIAGPEIAIGSGALEGHDLHGKAVLLATGWDRHWRSEEYGSSDHPYLTGEAAEQLAAGGAALVGIDSVNIDSSSDFSRPAHSTLLAADVPIVEHLTGLGDLVGTSFRFFAIPVKVRRLGTFPIRAFAALD